MKKYVLILLAAVMLILAACARAGTGATGETNAPVNTGTPTQTTAENQPTGTTQTPTTKPTETTAPPTTQHTEPSTQPTELMPTDPLPTDPIPTRGGYLLIYEGKNPDYWKGADLSEQCTEGYLYYINKNKEDIFLVCAEEVIMDTLMNINNTTLIYFVKQTEPTKIFAAYIDDITEHRLVYTFDESADINQIQEIGLHKNRNLGVMVLEGNSRVYWIDVETGEAEILLELWYIEWAYVGGGSMEIVDGEPVLLEIIISFRGKLHEDDQLGDYIYNHTTGEITAGPEL